MEFRMAVARAMARRNPHFNEEHVARIDQAQEPVIDTDDEVYTADEDDWTYGDQYPYAKVEQTIPCTCGKNVYAHLDLLHGNALGAFMREIC